MLTKTSELALKALLVVGLEGQGKLMGPKELAEKMECSLSYLAKILGTLVKARILQSVRGSNGGILLARAPGDITLLDVVEACQGVLTANYCQTVSDKKLPVCGFHEAMAEVYESTARTLQGWTLARLMKRPTAQFPVEGPIRCKMAFCGCEKHSPAVSRHPKGGSRAKVAEKQLQA